MKISEKEGGRAQSIANGDGKKGGGFDIRLK